jgi:hypothetical protein
MLDAQRYINEIIQFSLIWHLEKKDSIILCKTVSLHAQLTKIPQNYAVFRELVARIELLARVCWAPRSLNLDCHDFYLLGKLEACCVCEQPTQPGGSTTEYSWSNWQHSALNCKTFSKICLKNSGMSHSRGLTFWTSYMMVSTILITIFD